MNMCLDFEEAEELLIRAIEVDTCHVPPWDVLIGFYESFGLPGEAEAWNTRLMQILADLQKQTQVTSRLVL